MSDFFEVDFLDVETKKSGDAITMRYEIGGTRRVHIVDGGFRELSDKIIDHVVKYYDNSAIDYVLVTHPDGDHASGLQGVLERCNIGSLWMLRPWTYAHEIIHRFDTYNSVDRLVSRLKAVYPYIAALEDMANERGIPIYEPFQGAQIGAFTVLAPSRQRYLDLIVESEKTPASRDKEFAPPAGLLGEIAQAAATLVNFLKGEWGFEIFSPNETSAENEMSVVQTATIAGKSIVLTGDAGRSALAEAAAYAPFAGLVLPGVDRFQVPHHGSRRNVSTALLDQWLGQRLAVQPPEGHETFTAVCSSALEDKAHPRKAVERAFVHRGARFVATEGQNIRTSFNAPKREGWSPAALRPYPPNYEA